jgi:hypothetical protein
VCGLPWHAMATIADCVFSPGRLRNGVDLKRVSTASFEKLKLNSCVINLLSRKSPFLAVCACFPPLSNVGASGKRVSARRRWSVRSPCLSSASLIWAFVH